MSRLHCVLAIMLAVFTGCGVLGGVKGSGKIVTESRDVRGFTAVDFRDDGELVLEQTGNESLTITADDNILPYLRSEVRDGRLVIDHREQRNLQPTRKVIFKLSVKSLEGLDLYGDGAVRANGVHSDQLRIRLTGDGEIKISGDTERQEVNLTGDGRYEGDGLTTKMGTVQMLGDGKAVIAVADKLDVNITGDGSVEYIGNPDVTQHVTGDGSVRKR